VGSDELDGNTLSVYAFIVRADNPVGLREITRGVELSSSSVAYHHLQKLETLGLIEKNSYGQYSLKKKASIDGYMWVGKNLVPRLMFYSFFFIGLFAVETSTILYYLVIKSLLLEAWFLFFTGTTLVATLLFFIEGVALYHRLNPKRATVNS
jgi:hypothetical protein